MDARPEQLETCPTLAHQFGPADARDLLARTVELPPDQRGLLTVLREYRAALVALLTMHEAVSGAIPAADAADDLTR